MVGLRMFLEKSRVPRKFGTLKSVRLTYLMGFETLDSLLLFLLAEDNEWATVFVECKTHADFCCALFVKTCTFANKDSVSENFRQARLTYLLKAEFNYKCL